MANQTSINSDGKNDQASCYNAKRGIAMIEYKTKAEKRGSDQQGAGYFGAPRGSHTHNGIDYAMPPGSAVFSPVTGKVTKIGYPYSHDLSFRYVQITAEDGLNHRVFYVEHDVELDQNAYEGDTIIGYSQKLPYEGITQHVHYEIKGKDGNYIDPDNQP